MKKLLFLMILSLTLGSAVMAQDDKDKSKNTTTPMEKVHNTFSKNKESNGHMTKHKHNGHKHKHKHTNMKTIDKKD